MRPVIDRTGHDFESESLVFRTDFTNDEAWRVVVDLLIQAQEEFETRTHIVDDRAFEGASPEEVRLSTVASDPRLQVAFMADADTMRGEHPLLAVTTRDQEREDEDEEILPSEFRLLPDAVDLVHVNLAIGHMDYWEFAYHAVRGPGGIYRS
jgi:uncharacterized protein DUF6924